MTRSPFRSTLPPRSPALTRAVRRALPLLVAPALLATALAVAASAQPVHTRLQPADPCCGVVAVNARTGIVTARVKATGATFEFRVTNPRLLAGLHAGSAVYANFGAKQVSLDGRTSCCAITREPQTATAPARAPTPPITAPAATPPAQPSPSAGRSVPSVPSVPGTAPAVSQAAAQHFKLPDVAYGDPVPVNRAVQLAAMTSRFRTETVAATVHGHMLQATMLRVRGLNGIEQAPGLPDGVRRLLELHVRRIPLGEPDEYIIDPAAAQEWIKTHPVPDDLHPEDADKTTHSGCGKWTWHCVSEAYKHAEGEAERQRNALIDQAQHVWDHWSDELTHDWKEASGCLADHTLPMGQVPVQFEISPSWTVPFHESGNKSLSGGSASGKVDGSVTASFPMKADFASSMTFFYIPCLPFVFRPRSLKADGTLTVGEAFNTTVTATGSFKQTITVPPTGVRIPLYVVPIVIGHVPVAEMDVSAYLEGNLEVGGTGKAEGHFSVTDPHSVYLSMDCSGTGCALGSKGLAQQATAHESVDVRGRVYVKPAVFAALQLDFDVNALGARGGAQPFLLGTAVGCESANGTQSTDGSTSGSENHALAADVDWGLDVRADALVGGQVTGQYVHAVTGHKDGHLWFGDLAPGGSTALVADVTATPGAAGHPTAIAVRMPSCYPYTDRIRYHLQWSGTAAPASGTGAANACQWSGSDGWCWFDPRKDLPFMLTWQAPGSYTLAVSAVQDAHHRRYPDAPPRQVTVSIPAH